MDKNVNLIIYKPGYGGHFIRLLLSIDKSTFPFLLKNKTFEFCDQNRLYSSYKNLKEKYGHWSNHHGQFIHNNLIYFYLLKNTKYKSVNLASHPLDVYDKTTFINNHSLIYKINYLQVSLSEQYEYVIDNFKKNNNGFPELRPNENYIDEKIKQEFSPYIINFDNFILGEDHFVEEYTKLNKYLQLPLHLDSGLEMYRDWYIERKFSQYLGVGSEI